MCIRGFTQPDARTTGPASNAPEPPADPGVTEELRAVVELTAEETDAGIDLATAVVAPR